MAWWLLADCCWEGAGNERDTCIRDGGGGWYVATRWLGYLIISPPSTLVDEAPDKMDALVNDSSNTCSEPTYLVPASRGAALVSSETVKMDLVDDIST